MVSVVGRATPSGQFYKILRRYPRSQQSLFSSPRFQRLQAFQVPAMNDCVAIWTKCVVCEGKSNPVDGLLYPKPNLPSVILDQQGKKGLVVA